MPDPLTLLPQAPEPGLPPPQRTDPAPGENENLPVEAAAAAALRSSDRHVRREALIALERRSLTSFEISALGRALVEDPDPELRVLAVSALAEAVADLPFDVVERTLHDPDDAVRAAMVDAAAERVPDVSPLIVRLAVRRRWPKAQRAALRHLPRALDIAPARAEENLETLLSGLAEMEPPPLGSERPALAEVARAIGGERLGLELGRPGPRRLGSVRLLLMEGSVRSLERVAALAGDPMEEVRLAASAAANLLGDGGERGHAADDLWELTDDDLFDALAAALTDPSEEVRSRAREGLARTSRAAVAGWVERSLASPAGGAPVAGALVAEALHLEETAPAILARASATPAVDRGPFVGALDAFRLAPVDLCALVMEVDPAHRHEAVRLAWTVGARYVLPFVRTLVSDGSALVRAAALEILSEAADPAAGSLAEQALEEDPSATVRATAVGLLASAGGRRRGHALALGLQDADPSVRARAVEALPAGLAAEHHDVVVRAVRDEDERVWRAALTHLAALPLGSLGPVWSAIREADVTKRGDILAALSRGGAGGLTSLAESNAEAPDWADRALAVEVATGAGTDRALRVVVAAVDDPDPVVRRAAITALGASRTVQAVPALGRVLSDPQPDVRVEAVRALGRIDDHAVIPLLVVALKDPAPRVREMATEALAARRSPVVAGQLADALSSPDLRRQATRILLGMGETAVAPLVHVVVDVEGEAAGVAGELLGQISGPAPFLAQLSSRRPEERLRAIGVLAAIDGPNMTDVLLGALSDPEPQVRSRVVGLLGDVGDRRARDALRQVFLNDPVHEVANAAEESLRRLGGGPAEPDGGTVPLDG